MKVVFRRCTEMVLSRSEFWATFLAAIKLYLPDLLDPDLRTTNTPQSQVASEYDFIIAGAGSAGKYLVTENKVSNAK